MGGGEALYLASDPQYADLTKDIRGWILESPYVALPAGYEPNGIIVFFGKLVGKFLPNKQRFSGLQAENLTRDPEAIQSLKDDPLLHDMGTLEGLSGMLKRSAALDEGKVHLNPGIKSIWIGHGTDDKATSYPASQRWFEREAKGVEDREFKTYEGWYHQLHADLKEDQLVFAKDVGDWILARVDKQAPESKL